jgi:hypothetical protein
MAKAVLLLMRNYPELLISATKSGQLEIGYRLFPRFIAVVLENHQMIIVLSFRHICN